MKKILLISIILFSFKPITNAQSWAQPGAKWYYSNNTTFYVGYYKIEKISDTVINNINCDNYLTTEFRFNGNSTTIYNHEYTYQSNDTVYRWFNNQFIIYALYSSVVGDTWNFPVDSFSCSTPGYFLVDSIGETIINSDTLSVRYLTMFLPNMGAGQVTLTEKLGYSHTMFPYWSCTLDFYVPGPLRCYSDSTGFSYSTNIAPYCDFTTGISENNAHNNSLQIFPNPVNTFCTINAKGINHGTLILYDLMGRILDIENCNSNTDINLSKLKPGIYFVAVIGKDDKTLIGRFVKN